MSLLLVVYEMMNLVVVPDYRNLGAAGFTDSEVGDADERVTSIMVSYWMVYSVLQRSG
jgi:hypothetical protein